MLVGLELKFIGNRFRYLNIYIMASVIDVKTLSINEIKHLINDLIESDIITHEFLLEIAESKMNKNENSNDMAYIESLINKHFEEYDEVFRKLA